MRKCEGCGVMYERRPGEAWTTFRRRLFHDARCYATHRLGRGRQPGPSTEEKFWRYTNRSGACWLWTSTIGSTGYAVTKTNRQQIRVARWAYERFRGSIPAGLQIDHLCNVRSCVNPDHLEVVTAAENTRRRDLRKTHCAKRGHPWTPETTFWSDGRNNCRACYEIRRGRRAA